MFVGCGGKAKGVAAADARPPSIFMSSPMKAKGPSPGAADVRASSSFVDFLSTSKFDIPRQMEAATTPVEECRKEAIAKKDRASEASSLSSDKENNDMNRDPSMFTDFMGSSNLDIFSQMEVQTLASQVNRKARLPQKQVAPATDSDSDDDGEEEDDYDKKDEACDPLPADEAKQKPKTSAGGKTAGKGKFRLKATKKGKKAEDQLTPKTSDGVLRRQRATLKELHQVATSVFEPLVLTTTESDYGNRLSALPYNALCIEIRDLFRLMEGLVWRAEDETLTSADIAIFYQWFEGFYGIVTSIFEVMEDVVFSWLESIGALSMDISLAPKRRSTKATRTKDICWDILELKLQLQKTAGKTGGIGSKVDKTSLEDVVFELATEVEHLSMRILSYAATLKDQLPPLVTENFESAERQLMETSLYRNMKASKPGKFALAAFTRAIDSSEARTEFLHEVFVAGSKKKANAGLREYQKFFKMHVNVVDEIALTVSNITYDSGS